MAKLDILARPEVRAVLESPATKSDKIRALDRLGCPRARIADALMIKYQFVRNVLEGDKQRAGTFPEPPAAPAAVVAEAPPTDFHVGDLYRLTVGPGGTVQLPAEVLASFGARVGGVIVAELDGGRFTLLSASESMRRVRALVPPWRSGEPMASEELIADRRREAARDGIDG
jgi:hypothetical protein